MNRRPEKRDMPKTRAENGQPAGKMSTKNVPNVVNTLIKENKHDMLLCSFNDAIDFLNLCCGYQYELTRHIIKLLASTNDSYMNNKREKVILFKIIIRRYRILEICLIMRLQ